MHRNQGHYGLKYPKSLLANANKASTLNMTSWINVMGLQFQEY